MNREFLRQPHPHRVLKEGEFNKVYYKFNDYGFRCDNFTDCLKYKFRLLFVGGSNTEGMGLNVHECWAKLFHDMVCEKLNYQMPYWNIAVAASGTDHIARFLYSVGDLIQPNIIISWLPPIERRERFDSDFYLPGHDTDEKNNVRAFIDDRFIQYQTEKNFAFINLMLEKWNSTFIYRASHSCDYDRLDFGFRNMINIRDIPDINIENDLAYDERHPGVKTNQIFSKLMFEYCWPIIEKKFIEIT